MYHPGKVLRVFSAEDAEVVSADEATQAVVMMWDENLVTVLVHKNLSGKVNEDDVVLVDYRPMSSDVPVPKIVITKVLKGKHAAETWRLYKEKYRALKGKPLPVVSSQGAPVQPSHSYIG